MHHEEIAGAVKSQMNRVTKPGDERALHSFRCEFEDRIAVRHKEVTRTVKGHADRVDAGGKRTLLTVGCEFIDRVAVRVRDKKVPTAIKAQAKRVLKPSGKGALRSIGREFEDRMPVRFKEITCCVRGQAGGVDVDYVRRKN